MNPTPEQFARLPKWAQEHIADFERTNSVLRKQVSEMLDSLTPSPFYTEDLHSAGMVKRFLPGIRRIIAEHAGVKAEIYLPSERDGQRLFGIEICYSGSQRSLSHFPVAIMPRGASSIQLVHKDNL